MSLLQHLEQEAEHILAVLKQAINHEMQKFGTAHPKTQELVATLESHIDASAPAPAPVIAPAPVVDTAPATPVEPAQAS
jgi:hypothetical protein